MTAIAGIPGPLLEPGSDEWLATISASKISAIVGLNPWQSAFSLWHEMKGTVTRPPETDEHRRGHYLEPAIRDWLRDQHADDAMIGSHAGTWTHPTFPWATASPDGILVPDDHSLPRIVEVKTAASADEWGKALSDEIPPYYAAQVQWQMFVTGANVAHVAVLLPYLEFREYVVEYDGDEAQRLFDAAVAFRQSLADNIQPPLDSAASTYVTVRNLHPDIDDETAEIDEQAAWEWLAARQLLDEAKEAEQLCRSVVVDQMGSAHYAETNGWRLGDRRAKGEGVPYFQPARNLPTPEQVTEPRPAKDAA